MSDPRPRITIVTPHYAAVCDRLYPTICTGKEQVRVAIPTTSSLSLCFACARRLAELLHERVEIAESENPRV